MSLILRVEDYIGEVVFWDEYHGAVNGDGTETKFGTVYSASGRCVMIDAKAYFRNDLHNLRTTALLTCQK